MSIQVPNGWAFIEVLYNFFSLATVLFLFAFSWNFDTYIKKRRLKRLADLLSDILDIEGKS